MNLLDTTGTTTHASIIELIKEDERYLKGDEKNPVGALLERFQWKGQNPWTAIFPK